MEVVRSRGPVISMWLLRTATCSKGEPVSDEDAGERARTYSLDSGRGVSHPLSALAAGVARGADGCRGRSIEPVTAP